jgi:hypothetical protein
MQKLPEMKSKMVEYAVNNAKHVGEGLEVLPGVDSLLEVLSSNNVPVGLVCVFFIFSSLFHIK